MASLFDPSYKSFSTYIFEGFLLNANQFPNILIAIRTFLMLLNMQVPEDWILISNLNNFNNFGS